MPSPLVRQRAGILLLIAFAVGINVRYGVERAFRVELRFLGRGAIGAYEARFADLQRELPAMAAVGYWGDEVRDPATGVRGGVRAAAIAQYALAPCVVVQRSDTKLVVGNFHGPVPGADASAERGLVLVRDFGGGVLLFRRDAS